MPKVALIPRPVPMPVPGNEARIMYKELWNKFWGEESRNMALWLLQYL